MTSLLMYNLRDDLTAEAHVQFARQCGLTFTGVRYDVHPNCIIALGARINGEEAVGLQAVTNNNSYRSFAKLMLPHLSGHQEHYIYRPFKTFTQLKHAGTTEMEEILLSDPLYWAASSRNEEMYQLVRHSVWESAGDAVLTFSAMSFLYDQ